MFTNTGANTTMATTIRRGTVLVVENRLFSTGARAMIGRAAAPAAIGVSSSSTMRSRVARQRRADGDDGAGDEPDEGVAAGGPGRLDDPRGRSSPTWPAIADGAGSTYGFDVERLDQQLPERRAGQRHRERRRPPRGTASLGVTPLLTAVPDRVPGSQWRLGRSAVAHLGDELAEAGSAG